MENGSPILAALAVPCRPGLGNIKSLKKLAAINKTSEEAASCAILVIVIDWLLSVIY